jgi:hypothetical protein
VTRSLHDLRGFRRAFRRAEVTDGADIELSLADLLPVLLTLETARDLARLGAMRAEGVDAVSVRRLQHLLIALAIEVLVADAEAGAPTHIRAAVRGLQSALRGG